MCNAVILLTTSTAHISIAKKSHNRLIENDLETSFLDLLHTLISNSKTRKNDP